MIIESHEMIDRLKRGQYALKANCIQEQAMPETTAERFLLLQKEADKCDELITAFIEKLIGSEYE